MKPAGISRALINRVPLAKRAAAAAAERTISLAQAWEHRDLDRFELGGNHFQLFRSEKYNDPGLTALVVSHLGSVFNGFSLGIHLTNDAALTYVNFQVAAAGTVHSLSLYSPAQKAPFRFELFFNLNQDDLEMGKLMSGILGKGGQSLLALYNIAREKGTRTISYDVHEHNQKAKLFFAKMGFGSPTNPAQTHWIVPVILPSPGPWSPLPGI